MPRRRYFRRGILALFSITPPSVSHGLPPSPQRGTALGFSGKDPFAQVVNSGNAEAGRNQNRKSRHDAEIRQGDQPVEQHQYGVIFMVNTEEVVCRRNEPGFAQQDVYAVGGCRQQDHDHGKGESVPAAGRIQPEPQEQDRSHEDGKVREIVAENMDAPETVAGEAGDRHDKCHDRSENTRKEAEAQQRTFHAPHRKGQNQQRNVAGVERKLVQVGETAPGVFIDLHIFGVKGKQKLVRYKYEEDKNVKARQESALCIRRFVLQQL